MPDYTVLKGSTNVSVVLFIFDPATGDPETGIVFNTAGLDLEYRREGAASVDITEVTLAALTTAHTDGGFLHIGNGYYRLDLPDAAVASGVSGVLVHGTVPNFSIVGCYVHLVDYDPEDGSTLGLSTITDIQTDLTTHLLGFGTFGTINDTSPTAGSFTVSADFTNTNDHYNDLRCYILSGTQRGRRATITDQAGLLLTLGSGLTAAPENGAVVAIMS